MSKFKEWIIKTNLRTNTAIALMYIFVILMDGIAIYLIVVGM